VALWNWQSQTLDQLLAGFEMQPDVRSKVEDLYLEGGSLFYAVQRRLDAYPRVVQNIDYALHHQGNVVVELYGRKRHGKSTVARWLARQRWKCYKGADARDEWESKVIYDQAYSGSTTKVQTLARQTWEGLNGHADRKTRLRLFFDAMRFWLCMQDENEIEHHEDSQRAEHDLRNLIRTCASAQIDFFFLSTVQRLKESDFTLWVVGIDKKNQRDLSFYFDSEGHCHGVLITPNIPETEAYTESKSEGILEMLLAGGRRKAEIKGVEGGQTEAPIAIVVPPNAAFMVVLEASARQHLAPLITETKLLDRWLQRYFRALTHKELADLEGDIRADSVGRSLRDLDKRIDNTRKGSILEEALCAYLNQQAPASLSKMPLPAASAAALQQTSPVPGGWRRGVVGCDVAWLRDPAGAESPQLAVNAKLLLEHRPSWVLKCLPEAEVCGPDRAWLVLAELGPPQPIVHVYPCPTRDGLVDTGSVEEVKWEDWLDQLRKLVNP
jgi:hypothetical protein